MFKLLEISSFSHVYGGARYKISQIFVRVVDARANVFYARHRMYISDKIIRSMLTISLYICTRDRLLAYVPFIDLPLSWNCFRNRTFLIPRFRVHTNRI